MRQKTAQQICSNWHGGQWSAYYQYASSGIYLPANHLRYLQETEDNLHPEYALHPSELTKKDERELTNLKSFFILQGEKSGIKTDFKKHPSYGYLIPYITENKKNLAV